VGFTEAIFWLTSFDISVAQSITHTARRFEAENRRAASAALLWRERGDDFLEARIAAQRVPVGQQLQRSVACIEGAP